MAKAEAASQPVIAVVELATSSTAVDSSAAAARVGIVVVVVDRSPSEPSVVGPLHFVAS